MNLVSYEFVACQEAKKGVLILSEVRILHYAELNNMKDQCVLPSKLFISCICYTVCRSCTVTGCWSYSCESLEHNRSC